MTMTRYSKFLFVAQSRREAGLAEGIGMALLSIGSVILEWEICRMS